jgi:L-threonylcarbamoyladenylate synthase
MLMTATQAAGRMIQRYDLEGAADVLENEGLLLLPTDTLWCLACMADDPVALERMRRIKAANQEHPYELLFTDLEMLKQYAPKLHPRLETLLVYHRRPLTVLTDASYGLHPNALMKNGRMAARGTADNYCRSLIRLMNKPLATIPAFFEGSPFPDHFGRVRSDIIEAVDYVSRYRPKERLSGKPTIMVQIDQQEELEFIRE